MNSRSSIASRALVGLVVALVLGAGVVSAATATAGAGSTPSATGGEPLEESVVSATEDLENATNETTEDLENATNETTDTLDGAIDETTDDLENATDETTDGIDSDAETTDAVDSTVDGTTDAVGATTDDTTDAIDATASDSTGLLEGITTGTVAAIESAAGIDASAAVSVTDGDDPDDADGNRTADGADTEANGDDGDSDGDASGTSGGTDASTAADAVLVGLLGAITASGAAASGGSSAGASGLTGSWLGRSPGLRHLRRAGSSLPWKALPIFKYSRYDDSDPLENDRRRAIYETIEADPGCYLSELGERSDVALSTVRHHVRVLEDEGLVTTAKVNGKRRYYLADGAEAATRGEAVDVELHAALEEPAKREVLETLATLGAAHNGRLADELDRDPSTVSHHLSALADDGLVVREKEGRAVVNELAPAVETALREGDAALEDDPAETSAPADD